jgi:hypothetical protein
VPPKSDMFDIPEVPRSAEPYGTYHPDRIKKFPYLPRGFSPILTEGNSQWRHELDHDTESVFWLLLYWLVGAQPENQNEEPILAGFWGQLTGSVDCRTDLLLGYLTGATHSFYQPLLPLLKKLAHVLSVDRHWLQPSDPRKDPGYISEAFQRLIFQFILEHRNDTFMKHRVSSQTRRPEQMSKLLSLPSRKRTLSEPTIPGGTKRLRMAEKMIEVGRRFARCVCFNGTFSGFSEQRRKRESVCRRSRRNMSWGE